ncbi:hypothetical protein BDA99DRAFT_536243 [Phascolomyces articulosus]|uniref:Fungal lipase-type domain-containing protein n=1 Tax=Phascolomyces articulosus TaxID=60185 RepID=A0AAD5K335_9FUNG|nr:hypothetical protein BDA99DRAFT_536243 [Phascolomyces articulosus]
MKSTLFQLTFLSSPFLSVVVFAVALVTRQESSDETPEGEAIERNRRLPEDTDSIFNMVLNSTCYLDTVKSVLKGTFASALAATRDDLTAVFVNCPSVSLARIHGGFLGYWQGFKSTVTRTIESELRSHSDFKLVVQLPYFAALNFHADDVKNLELFTQGQPRVGNCQFAQHIVNTGITYKRAVYARDLVLHIPNNLKGFYHAEVCLNDLETSGCSNSIALFTCVLDHTTHFGMSTGICL